MGDGMIYILSGGIKSGKTTKLLEFCQKNNDVYGILSPVMNGKKIFMDAHTREQFIMEREDVSVPVLQVGKYLFDQESFKKASNIIWSSLNQKKGWVIIDEIGPLELNKQGFYEVVTEIISKRPPLNILFVMRETIVNKAMEFFKLDAEKVRIIDTSANILND